MIPRAGVQAPYAEVFMTALRTIATPRRHVNVLQHMAGYVKTRIDADSRAELQAVIHDYSEGFSADSRLL